MITMSVTLELLARDPNSTAPPAVIGTIEVPVHVLLGHATEPPTVIADLNLIMGDPS